MRIDKNIPIPDIQQGAKGVKSATMTLISNMEYGDSVLFKTRKRANYFGVQVRYFLKTRKKSGRACVRTVSDGFRVWLLKPEEQKSKYAHVFDGLARVQNSL